MIIFYSGDGPAHCPPEVALGDEANIMLSYFNSEKTGKPTKRFKAIIKKRKKRIKKGKTYDSQ